jgi:group I intron endonuclease
VWDGEPNNAGRFAIPFWRIHYDQDMRCTGIYRIDLGNGNFYIGSAVDLARRERDHRSNLRLGNHTNQIVQNCWNKYGVFKFIVLEQCKISELLFREQLWIDKYFCDPKNTNIAPIAGSSLGVVHSTEARANMSAWQKGKPKSAETRAKISTANKGRVYSNETRTKIASAQKGKTKSAETRAKISAANKGRVLPKRSMDHIAKISSVNKGRIRSLESRAKMSVSAQKRWAKVKMGNQPMEEMEHGKECS